MELIIDYLHIQPAIPNLPSDSLLIGLPATQSAMLIPTNSKLTNINVDYVWATKQSNSINFTGDNIPIDKIDSIHFHTTYGNLFGLNGIKRYPEDINTKTLIVLEAFVTDLGLKTKIFINLDTNCLVTSFGEEFKFDQCWVLVQYEIIDYCQYKMKLVKLSDTFK